MKLPDNLDYVCLKFPYTWIRLKMWVSRLLWCKHFRVMYHDGDPLSNRLTYGDAQQALRATGGYDIGYTTKHNPELDP